MTIGRIQPKIIQNPRGRNPIREKFAELLQLFVGLSGYTWILSFFARSKMGQTDGSPNHILIEIGRQPPPRIVLCHSTDPHLCSRSNSARGIYEIVFFASLMHPALIDK